MNTEEPVEDIEDMETNEEYRIWKKNVPYLYDTVIIKALVWPSLTVQWLPVVNTPIDADYATHKIIMGTHTSENEQNYLIIAKVHLPTAKSTQETSLHFDHKRVEIEAKICHDGEVNKARYCPQDPQLIATKTVVGEVHIFNCQNQLSKLPEGKANPDLKLLGHSKEGFGLSWNANQKGTLLSSADDHLICMWDINSNQASNSMEPVVKYDYHKNVVGDVCWHKKQPAIFGSVDDDKKVMIWDTRKENKMPAFEIDAHKAEIFCIDFNPLNEFLFATGSSDKTACIWDLKNLSQPLATLSFHQDDVIV
jgi:histone-binding protein RBBP4